MPAKIAFISLVIILLLVNASIYKKESHLSTGTIVYLELAPVDPRSLMQGDYMALRFDMANRVDSALRQLKVKKGEASAITDGYVLAQLNDQHVATFKALQTNQPLAKNEILLRYRVRSGTIKFATNAFFFQEGHAASYEKARYGQFRVDNNGELLLAGMYDKELKHLVPKEIPKAVTKN